MSRGRTAAIAVALIAIISLCGACSSGGSKGTAAADKRAAAANKAAAAKNRAAIVKRRAAVAKRRAKAAKKPKHAKPRVAPATTTPTSIETVASTTPGADLAAIQGTVDALNAAFRAGVSNGISNSEGANYWVGADVYTAGECGAFEAARGQGIVSENLVVHVDSLTPAPGWVDPVIGQVPQGRIYQMAIDEIQTLVTTGQQRERTFPIHVTVRSDGHARLFLRCR